MGGMTISSNLLEMLFFIITRHVRPISLPIVLALNIFNLNLSTASAMQSHWISKNTCVAMAYSRSAIVEYIYMPSVELDSRLIPMYSRMVIRLFLVPRNTIHRVRNTARAFMILDNS